MTFTVTPQPNNVPPRVRIDMSTDDSTRPFTSLVVYRNGKRIRQQPYVGSHVTVAFDYEAPFGVSVTYSAVGEIADLPVVVFGTTWANLTGWTTVSGTPIVSSQRLTASAPGSAVVERSVAIPDSGRVTLAAPLSEPGGYGWAQLDIGSGFSVVRSGGGGPPLRRTVTYRGQSVDIVHTSGQMTMQWNAGGLSITTPEGSWSISGSRIPSSDIVRAAVSIGYVPAFTIEALDTVLPFNASASTELPVDEAWLIHPTFPTLSCSIDPGQHRFRDDGINVDGASKGTKTRAARSAIHEAYGRKNSVVITSGPRAAAEWDLRLRTRRLQDRDDVEAIVEDQTPLLLRSPADWSWDLPDGWYSVQDFVEERPRLERLDAPDRLMTLPLLPVDEPIVRQGAVWTFGMDLMRNPTFADSRVEFPTFLDRLVGPAS